MAPHFLQDQINCSSEILGLGEPVSLSIPDLLAARAAEHQDTMAAECLCRKHVAHAVAHPPALGEIDLELLRRLTIEQHTWLTAVARPG